MLRFASSIFFSFLISYCFGQTATIDFKGNTTLTFVQNVNGVKSDLKLVIQNDAKQPTPTISWTVPSGEKSLTKVYNYSARSVENSNTLYLKIDEAFIPVADADVILISRRNFGEINIGKTAFNINGAGQQGFVVAGKDKYSLFVDGKQVQVEAFHLKSLNNTEELWILNNGNYPIILRASGFYNLDLSRIDL